MTAPATPVDVVRQLSALTERLYEHVRAYSDAERKAAEARNAAEEVEVRAFMNCDGAMDLRKNTAREAALTRRGEAAVAEAAVRGLKAKIRALEVDIDVHRTYGATMRAELSTLGRDGAP